MRRLDRRFDIGDVVARGLVGVFWLLCVVLIVLAAHGSIHDLAGKNTNVDISVIWEASLSLSVVVNAGQWLKGKSQRSEMKRERERADNLEQILLSRRTGGGNT